MVLSHVLVWGIRVRAASVRSAAYDDLRMLYELERSVAAVLEPTDHQADEAALATMRDELSKLSARCGRNRVELAFGAEAMLDVEVVIPSSIVGHYHRSVVRVSRVSDMVKTATLLIERLESAVATLRIVVETAEREADERRNAHLAKVGGFLAAVGLVLTFVFGFYGSNVAPIGTRPLFANSGGYQAFAVAGVLLTYAVAAALLRDPWLQLGRLGRERLRRPGA
jgi:Mg2+ and Co2+ transporter CorA